MSQVDNLRSARGAVSVKFMDFMKAASHNKNILVCFFEGEDEKYYSIRLNNIRPDLVWTGIDCKGKGNVLSLRDKISKNSKYNNSFVAFFVDHDFFDENSSEHSLNTYVTPCYSIENNYVNIETYGKILEAEFGIKQFCSQTNDYKIAIDIFEKRFQEFCTEIFPFNIWICAHRYLEKDATDKIGSLNINNINIDSLVQISLGNVSSVYDINDIGSLFPEAANVSQEAYNQSKQHLEANNNYGVLRGKQQLEFLRVLISKLKVERSKRKRSIFLERSVVKLQLTKANTLSELSQYAFTPECLQSFLQGLNVAV